MYKYNLFATLLACANSTNTRIPHCKSDKSSFEAQSFFFSVKPKVEIVFDMIYLHYKMLSL